MRLSTIAALGFLSAGCAVKPIYVGSNCQEILDAGIDYRVAKATKIAEEQLKGLGYRIESARLRRALEDQYAGSDCTAIPIFSNPYDFMAIDTESKTAILLTITSTGAPPDDLPEPPTTSGI